MQHVMQKVYIPGVQLAVPQHIYDKLGLHLNQTVVVKNLQSLGELENNIPSSSSAETSNNYDEPLLTQPEIKEETSDESSKSSLDKHNDMLLGIVINAENGKQITTTLNLKASSLSSNSQTPYGGDTSEDESSNSSDDGNASTELHTYTPVLAEPDNDKINKVTTNKSSSGSHSQGRDASSAGNESEKRLYPRDCAKCHRRYVSKGSFRNHKKNCGRYAVKTLISYPRRCTNCNRSYGSACSFSRHKEKCEEYKRQAADNSTDRTYYCVHGHELRKMNANASSADNGKELYATNCTICAVQCFNRGSSSDSVTKEKQKLTTYPRTCTVCSKIYFSRSAFWYHKRNVCNPFKRPANNNNNIMRASSFLSFTETIKCENDLDTTDSFTDLEELPQESAALSDQDTPRKWIPVTSDSCKPQTYFVVNKTSS